MLAIGTSMFYSYVIVAEKMVEANFHEATTGKNNAAVKFAVNDFNTYESKSGKDKAVFLECIATAIEALQ